MQLVLGTHNRKKGAELQALLSPFGFELKTLADFDDPLEVVEDGDSFQANAHRKAVQQSQHLDRWVIGEDSGLCVRSLDGAPGIYSARYAGPAATDDDNNQKLLKQLENVSDRSAFYVSHVTLADPQGQVQIDCEATCHGRIVTALRGSHGFGYDPLFELAEYHRTFGELGPAIKSVLSHRARAIRQFIPRLLEVRDKVSVTPSS